MFFLPSPHTAHARRMRLAAGRGRRAGLTLVEMLISVAVTLVLVLAVVQVFAVVGANVRVARSVMELANDLRGVARQIQQDLDAVTCPVHTWIDPESGLGYFEVIEGPLRDRDFIVARDGSPLVVLDNSGNEVLNANAVGNNRRFLFYSPYDTPPVESTIAYDSSFGDLDDCLAMTIRSEGQPFVGRGLDGSIVESQEAEVIYWTAFLDYDDDATYDANEPIYLMRRQLLIAPNQDGFSGSGTVVLRDDHDISIGPNGRANSLGDLTHPPNRPLHAFPAAFPRRIRPVDLEGNLSLNQRYLSRFVLMTDLRGFDIRLYDPLAPIVETNAGVVLSPGDPGYPIPTDPSSFDGQPSPIAQEIRLAYNQNRWVGRGAFVDLAYAVTFDEIGDPLLDPAVSDLAAIGNWFSPANPLGRISYFSGVPSFYEDPTSSVPDRRRNSGEPFWNARGVLIDDQQFKKLKPNAFRYDTWSTYFERDGLDPFGQPISLNAPFHGLDRATNGRDDDGINGVDDPGERDTAPPYDAPLRGIEVRLRMMHFEMRQVRQVSIVSDFVPE